jgi:putative transposase
VRFIAGHAAKTTADGLGWGVEPICAALTEQGRPIAPSTYYEHQTRARLGPTAGQARDQALMAEIQRVWKANYPTTAFTVPARCGWR